MTVTPFHISQIPLTMNNEARKDLNRAVAGNAFPGLLRSRRSSIPAGLSGLSSRGLACLGVQRGAFTLIELLVSVGIVIILTGVAMSLLPGLSKRSKSISCISNLKTLGQIVLIYANEHNGNTMTAYDGTNLWYMHLSREGYLNRDTRRKILTCPSFAPYKYTEEGSNNMYTYGLRRWGAAVGQATPAWSLGKYPRLANFVLLADSYKAQTKHQFYYVTVPDSHTGAPEQIHLRHGDHANIFFADGSVRGLSRDEILNLNDGWTARAILETEDPQ